MLRVRRVGKRVGPPQVSSVVRMSTIAQIDSKSHHHSFTKIVQAQVNGIAITIEALCDTGADTSLLINHAAARRMQQQLGTRLERLEKPIQLSDYRCENAGKITKKLTATLEIDKRRFPNQTFLVTECGHDLFIGQHWLAEQDVWIHPRTRAFHWPDKSLPLAKFAPAITLPKPDPEMKLNLKNQQDADRRDRAMAKEMKRIQILQGPWRGTKMERTQTQTVNESVEDDQAKTVVAKLMAQLKDDPRRERWAHTSMPKDPVVLETGPAEPAVKLAAIGSTSWKTHHHERIPFPEDEDPEHVKLVREKLPAPIAHLEGFFSKKASTKLPARRPGHDVILELDKPVTGTPPTYRTPVQFLPLEKDTVDELLKIGFIEPCMQPNAAPVLFVPKPHSTDRRFCTDYRWINQFLKDRLVPAPDVNGTIFNCKNAKRYTKIDVIRAFNRLRIAVGSEYLTAFRTRQGTFQWKVLPFGLKVGPAWWQQFINAQLNELLDRFATAYADDVLIYSDEDEEQEHWDQVEEVIHRLNRVDLQGDIKKSRFNVAKVDYLGIVMEAGVGISIDPDKLKAISDWKLEDLTSKTAIRSFLGLCNYVRMFCYHASAVAEPLNRLLKKETPFGMGPEQKEAFENMKRLACEAPVIAFFVPGRPTKVETDASRNATGGVI